MTELVLKLCENVVSDNTDTPTNCSENITPPRFRGGVKMVLGSWYCEHMLLVQLLKGVIYISHKLPV